MNHNGSLTELPTPLPPPLRVLDLRNNGLRSLPAALPDTLEVLNASRNQLASLPSPLPSQMRSLRIGYVSIFPVPHFIYALRQPRGAVSVTFRACWGASVVCARVCVNR